MFTGEDNFDAIVYQAAAWYGIDPALILATIAQESSFIPTASRFEPARNESSIGLMQVLQSTAAWMGWPADETLFDPSVNIFAGTEYLRRQTDQFGPDLDSVISSYNQGGPYRQADGTFKNQAYVDKVLGYFDYFKKKFKAEIRGRKNRFKTHPAPGSLPTPA